MRQRTAEPTQIGTRAVSVLRTEPVPIPAIVTDALGEDR
jgi:hypothetical protein